MIWTTIGSSGIFRDYYLVIKGIPTNTHRKKNDYTKIDIFLELSTIIAVWISN